VVCRLGQLCGASASCGRWRRQPRNTCAARGWCCQQLWLDGRAWRICRQILELAHIGQGETFTEPSIRMYLLSAVKYLTTWPSRWEHQKHVEPHAGRLSIDGTNEPPADAAAEPQPNGRATADSLGASGLLGIGDSPDQQDDDHQQQQQPAAAELQCLGGSAAFLLPFPDGSAAQSAAPLSMVSCCNTRQDPLQHWLGWPLCAMRLFASFV
jgi:hypothetical protein